MYFINLSSKLVGLFIENFSTVNKTDSKRQSTHTDALKLKINANKNETNLVNKTYKINKVYLRKF